MYLVFLGSRLFIFSDLSPDEFLYEQDNSDKLMDDIDNMLRDLNKELDDLIPGI